METEITSNLVTPINGFFLASLFVWIYSKQNYFSDYDKTIRNTIFAA